MRKSSPFPFLPDLERPLRGGTSLADATEEALEPAAKLRPEPLRAARVREIAGRFYAPQVIATDA